MGKDDKKGLDRAQAKIAKREAARKKKERIQNLMNRVREMEEMNQKIEVDFQEVVAKNKDIITELKETKLEIDQFNENIEKLALQEDEDVVGDVAPEEDEKEEEKADDGDKTPRQVYISPAELEKQKRKELSKFQTQQKIVQQNVDSMVN